MAIRFVGSIGICLTAAGLALGDAVPPAKTSQAVPTPSQNTQTDKKPDDKQTPTPSKEPERLLSPPTLPPQNVPTNGIVAEETFRETKSRTVDLRDHHIGPGHAYWANLEYLWWWTENGPLPVTIARSSTGAVLGNGDFTYDDSPGARLTVGAWLDAPHHVGFEVSGMVLARNRVSGTLESDPSGEPHILRPITNALTNSPASFIVSFPGIFSGATTVTSLSRFWGAEANLVRNLISDCDCELDLLFGFRYIDLDENLNIDQSTTVLSGAVIPLGGQTGGAGSTLTLSDRFVTRNNVFLGQVGARASMARGPFTLGAVCKVGFGPNVEQVRIDGSSQLTGPGVDAAAVGGLLALAGTNIGLTRTSWFAVVPEVGAHVGWDLTPSVRLHAGYSFLYLNSVVRPGDQINVSVNPTFVPSSGTFGNPSSPAQPDEAFRKTDYWVHGITAGVLLRY